MNRKNPKNRKMKDKESKKIKRINLICRAKLKKYFDLTGKALDVAKKAIKTIDKEKKKEALAVIDMARRYYDDAKYFENKRHYVNAFAALNYAHGWLDCGSKLGLFKVKDSKLFVLR